MDVASECCSLSSSLPLGFLWQNKNGDAEESSAEDSSEDDEDDSSEEGEDQERESEEEDDEVDEDVHAMMKKALRAGNALVGCGNLGLA